MSKSIGEHAIWCFGVGQEFGYLNVEIGEFGAHRITSKRVAGTSGYLWLEGVRDLKAMEVALRKRAAQLRLVKSDLTPEQIEQLKDALERISDAKASAEKNHIDVKSAVDEAALRCVGAALRDRLALTSKRGHFDLTKLRVIVKSAIKTYDDKIRLYPIKHERAPLCFPSLLDWLWYLDTNRDKGNVGSICADCTESHQEAMRQLDRCARPDLDLERERRRCSGGDEWSVVSLPKRGRPAKRAA